MIPLLKMNISDTFCSCRTVMDFLFQVGLLNKECAGCHKKSLWNMKADDPF